MIATIPKGPGDSDQSNLLLEVSTRDMSESGARIAGSPLLRVGQNALLRTGKGSGLVMSSYGRVVRKARGTQAPSSSEWGLEFDRGDAETLRQLQVFTPEFHRALEVNPHVAVIVSHERLELFWWLGQLSRKVRRVLVSSKCPNTLERMRVASPGREICSLGGQATKRTPADSQGTL